MPRRPSAAALPGWLLAELGPLLALATVLTGSAPGAVDLVTRTLARDPSWADRGDGYDQTPRLRVGLVRTFLASPLGRSRPPAGARGLDALTGTQRAAVVLRDGERLTVGEIAGLLDRPAARVAGELAHPDRGAGTYDAEIAELRSVAPPADEVAERYGPTRRTLRSTRRTRVLLLGVAAVVALAAVLVPTTILPRLPQESRAGGEWRFSHVVDLAAGWQLRYRTITPDTEETAIALPWPQQELIDCTVTVTVPGTEFPRTGTTEPTTVSGRPGELLDRGRNDLALRWWYADDAWASVDCLSEPVTADVLYAIADRVRFRDDRLRLPFTLTALPADYTIRMVGRSDDSPWGPFLVLDPPDESYWPVLIVGPHTSDGDPTEGVERCLGADNTICVTAAQSDDQIPVNRGIQRRVLATTVDLVRPAADPADPGTWFDAADLP